MSATAVRAAVLDGSGWTASVIGGKGAALDRLIGWGFAVPPTAVVTADTYRILMDDPELAALVGRVAEGDPVTAADVDVAFLSAPIDATTVAEIVGAARAVACRAGMTHCRLAVRSSATVEDMQRVSFAGQYRSILDVDPDDEGALLRAVRLVFASLWHPAPVAYRRSFGVQADAVAMAVVLMAMVPARRAGVVFTVDPSGDGTTARIEAVQGVAESLVSGRETPVATVLSRSSEHADAATEVLDALHLAMRVEALAGVPQDVEWAWDGERVWLVQARPITTVANATGDGFDDSPSELAEVDLTTAGIGEMLPGVLPPLVWEVSSFLVEEAFRSTFADLGVRLDDLVRPRLMIRRVRGRAAMDFGLLGTLTAQLPGADVAQLEEQYFGSGRPGRAAPATPLPQGHRLARARTDLRMLRSRRRADQDAELAIRAVEAIAHRSPELAGLADDALAAYWLRLVDLGVRAMTAELGVAAEAAATYRGLELSLASRLGERAAARAAATLTTRAGVTAPPSRRASASVFAGPTWEELGREPPRAAASVADAADPVDELRSMLTDVAGDRGEGLRAALRMRVALRTIENAVDQLARREHVKAAVLALGGEVRRVHLEAGRRLAARGAIPSVDDVDLLSVTELWDALVTDERPAGEVLARRRRTHHRDEAAGPLPARFTGADPRQPLRQAADASAGDRLEGWAVSGGRFAGRAMVVASPDDRFDADAVLVADATDPSWSPLFMRAGAIVLERGGPLSHAAILARELGVPAVTNVPGAVRRLDGRRVVVDGDDGLVVVLDEEAEP
jgi:pyruvate,water dikinase